MTNLEMAPPAFLDGPPGVSVLEAEPGPARRALLERWTADLQARDRRAWLLPCAMDEHGLWAGLSAWLAALLPGLRAAAPDLVERHSRELATVLPELRRELHIRQISLTDIAAPNETVRNYAIDRAYRLGQGIVDLLDAWHRREGAAAWYVLCDDYDHVGALVGRFFRELVRRRGARMGLRLLAAVAPGNEARAAGAFVGLPVRVERTTLPASQAPAPPPEEMTRLAEELERRVGTHPLEIEINIPQLIRLWSASTTPERGLRWHAMAVGLYNHHGFYEDALTYAPQVRANIDLIAAQDEFFTRWNLVGSLFGCLVAVGEVENAHAVVKQEAFDKIDDPGDMARVCYVMAMLHARFLPRKDVALAEQYIERGLQELERAEAMPPRDRHFLRVFLMNGLAFIRHRQGRPAEAVQLCETGFEQLRANLKPDEHRLHRSVLLYNMAQVHASVGEHQRALEAFGGAMDMDPNYSEYYNERGCVFLAMGRHEEALADFRQAIELSAPYSEVWTNMGQCYRQMGDERAAVDAFSHALDIDPSVALARLGRAECLDALGLSAEALADYDAILAADAGQPLVLANRAALRYGRGDLDGALADLDAAVALDPGQAQIHYNRGVALEGLRRPGQAADEFEAYLKLLPDADDSAEIRARISALRAPASDRATLAPLT